MKITINAAKESLDSLISKNKQKEIEIKDFETEEIINDLFEIFKQTTKWNNNPPDHPVIVRFRDRIIDHIKRANLINKIPEFVINFNTKIHYDFRNNSELKVYLETSKLKNKSLKRLEYLEYLRANLDKVNTTDKKHFSEYYIINDFVKLEDSETWDLDDYKIEEKYSGNEKWSLDDFLKSGYRKVIITASFGMGKTSFAKHIAIDYAKQHLDGQTTFIPIFVSLKDNLRNVYMDYTLERLINKIISPSDDEKIILICDGLDEYDEDKVKKIDELEELTDKFPNIEFKIIITTRLIPNFHIDFNLKSFEYGYVRLLPFRKEQVNEFYSSMKYNLPNISYETLKENGLQDQEIRKPLFCWMYAITQQQEQDNEKITNTNDVELSKTILYFNFIHSILKGKYSKDEVDKINFEKWIFRKIAALKKIYKDKLYESEIRDKLVQFIDSNDENNSAIKRFLKNAEHNNENLIDPMLISYFQRSNKVIEFIHKSFLDYLIAEYYIESILINKPYRLNVGSPSPETIIFMKSLLKIFLNNNDPKLKLIFNKFISSVYLDSNNQSYSNDTIINKLIKNCKEAFEDEYITILKQSSKNKRLWINYKINDYQEFYNFLISKCLSLFIIKYLSPITLIDKDKLINFVKNHSFHIPYFIKNFSNSDFSNANLSNVDLGSAILVNTNLSNVSLTSSILSKADLSNANLMNGELQSAILHYSNFSGADLTNASLYQVYSVDADFDKVKLMNANLCNCHLNECNFNNANLMCADLLNSSLAKAYFNYANLSYAYLIYNNFYNTKFKNTDFSYAFIIYPSHYLHANFEGANFTGTIIIDNDFIDYISKFTDKLPKKINNKKELELKLKERELELKSIKETLSNYNIKSILEFSKLPE